MADIRATTQAHTDIADVLLSMNGADTVVSLHAKGKATVLKMPRKEGLSLSEIGDVIKPMTTTFETCGKVTK